LTTTALTRAGERLYRMPVLLLVLCTVFWAGNTVAARIAIGEIGPFMLTALRWVMVAAALWPIYGGEIRAHWGDIRRRLPWITLLGTLGMSGFNAFYYVAAHYTSAINIGILQGSMPIFVLAVAYLAHGTRASLIQWAGVLITALGVVVVATRGAPLDVLYVELNVGDLAVLAACALYALYTVALRDRPAMPGNAFFALLSIIAAITSLPLVGFEAYMNGFRLPTATGLAVTVWIAIFPSFLSQIFYLRGVDLIGPGRAGVFINLVPVFAAAMAVTLISEPFKTFHGVALALVIGGIWLAQRTGK
jgi:drug/metabolite transporter (DMT)-like permease